MTSILDINDTIKQYDISDLVIGLSDNYINDLLIGIVIEHRKLMGFHCYKICWALDTTINPVEGLESEWFKQKELSLFQKAIKI